MLQSRFPSTVLVLVLGLSPSVVLLSCGGTAGPNDLGGSDATTPSDAAGADGQGSPGDATAEGTDATGTPTDATTDAGGSLRDVACTPGCPADVQCGLYTDCTGNTLVCGKACGKGQTCTVQGSSQSCQPTSTTCAGRCGDVGIDPCGVVVSCGGCPAGNDCVNQACIPQTTTDAGHACGSLMCSGGGQSFCGTLTDGCGHTMPCTCPAGQQCYSGLCMTPPPECADTDAGAACGAVPNACGSGNIQCGPCAGGATCVKNVCTSCTPRTCTEVLDGGAATSCTPVDLGCGQKKSCLPCGAGDVCIADGGCCQPKTCGDFPDASCGTVDLGCGITKACNTCNSADECVNNSCVPCQARTCANFPGGGCNLSDGCGHKLDCCPSDTACQGGLCCPKGQVNYQGSCCQPQCDNNQPPGPQESCGQIILCNNN
jgi:hypothetical protein